MAYTLGQQAILSTLVTDVSTGLPADATMSLTVTAPDGSTLVSGVGLTINHTGTGAYSCVVLANQPGTWLYLWTASGAAVGVDDGQFDVLAITRRIVSIADAKIHMNKQLSNTADDVELQGFIDAAQSVVQREIGDVVPTAYVETLPTNGRRIVLSRAPVISVTVLKIYNSTSAPVTLDPTEYRLDQSTGIIERLNGGYPIHFEGWGSNSDVYIQYLAGVTGPVPPNVRLATLELIAHLWRNSQMGRGRRTRGTGPEDDMATVGLGFSLPNRVRELLGPKRPAMF